MLDSHYEFLKAVDDPVLTKMKKVVDDSIKQISRNMHNIIKLMRKIMEYCSPNGKKTQNLRDIFKPVKLETWLSYFDGLTRKINNSFTEISIHLHNLLNEDDRVKLYEGLGINDGYSLTEILNKEIPELKEEITFLLGFISYPNRQFAGILEQHQRPDGGTHITSKSIATTPAAILMKAAQAVSDSIDSTLVTTQPLPAAPPKKPAGTPSSSYFEILSRESIDCSKFKPGDFSNCKFGSLGKITCLDMVSKNEVYLGTTQRGILRMELGDNGSIGSLQTVHGRL